jgi:hypothetical protein
LGDALLRRARFFAVVLFEGAAALGLLSFAGARFDDEVNFGGLRCTGPASFDDAVFARDATFDGMRAASTIAFARAAFGGDASFAACEFAHGVDFAGARFAQRLNVEWSEFPSLEVGGVAAGAGREQGKPPTVVALRGGQFAILTSRMAKTPQPSGPAGTPGRARSTVSQRELVDAFYRRRKREGDALQPARYSPASTMFWADWLRVAGDRSLRWLTGYGVRPLRILTYALAAPLLAFGLFVATPQDAPKCVRATTPASAAYLTLTTYTSADRFMTRPPRASECGDAGTALPAVDVERVDRLAGLIFLPLLLLTVTGVLRTLLGFKRM